MVFTCESSVVVGYDKRIEVLRDVVISRIYDIY